MINLLNMDNMEYEHIGKPFDLIYADYIYENSNFSWIDKFWELLRVDGIMILQTDWHTLIEAGYYMKHHIGANFVNHICWKNEFGNFPKTKFRQSHDDILIFSKGKNYTFYPDRVQVTKATANSKGLNPSGRDTKLATSVWTDICLTTISKERIKKKNGKNIRWQKPERLLERLFIPFVNKLDRICDPFMGVGTSAVVSNKLGCDYVGIELDEEPYKLAIERTIRKGNQRWIVPLVE